jgi:uncharacterized surface protein with fasciclin (FAS1) repeats
MKSLLSLLVMLIFAIPAFSGGSCGSKSRSYAKKINNQPSIVETALSAGNFTTLTRALGAAGLVDALSHQGPFTVLAPTDDAFAKLPKETLNALLQPENKPLLVNILKYHVISGSFNAKHVVANANLTTLNGQRLVVDNNKNGVFINESQVIKADISTSNGIIHVIDKVLLPSDESLIELADKAGSFKTLLAAVEAADLKNLLAMDGPFTILAPTDEAFAKLPKATLSDLLKPENRDQLAAILKYHVIPGRVYAEDAVATRKAGTALGQDVTVRVASGRLRVNQANVLDTDLAARNGVIHVIDEVLIPN